MLILKYIFLNTFTWVSISAFKVWVQVQCSTTLSSFQQYFSYIVAVSFIGGGNQKFQLLMSYIVSNCLQVKKKYMCVYCHMSKKSRVCRSGLIFFYYFFLLSTKQEIVVPGSGIRFRYLILLLVKQQKWLSEFCVKMHRVASKNQGRSGDRKHTFFFFWPYQIHRTCFFPFQRSFGFYRFLWCYLEPR